MKKNNTPKYTVEEIRTMAAQWDAENDAQKLKYNEQYYAYDTAKNEIFDDIKAHVLTALADVDLPFQISVEDRFIGGIDVYIRVHDNNVHGENKALSWTWKVLRTKDGNIEKQTSSWSGLQATTAVQLADLRKTVDALEILNSIDWENILNVTLPEYREYVTEKDGIGPRPAFGRMENEAAVSELVGTDTLIKGKSKDGYTQWFHITKESGSMYVISHISDYYIENCVTREDYLRNLQYTERITKEKMLDRRLQFPLETRAIPAAEDVA